MQFEVVARSKGWVVTNGPMVFGPYPTQTKAQVSAGKLNREPRWLARTPEEIAALAQRSAGRGSTP